MEESIEDLLKSTKPHYSNTTIILFTSCLKFFQPFLEKETLCDLFQDVEEIFELINSRHIVSATKRNFIRAIVLYLTAKKQDKELIKKYNDLLPEILGKKPDMNDVINPDNIVSVESIEKYIEVLKESLSPSPKLFSELFRHMQYITLLINFTYLLRNDLCNAIVSKKILNDDQVHIFIDNKKEMVKIALPAPKKSSRTNNSRQILLLPDIADEVISYVNVLESYKQKHKIKNNFFLIDKKGKQLTTYDFTIFFLTIFSPLKKHITTTTLRKILLNKYL